MNCGAHDIAGIVDVLACPICKSRVSETQGTCLSCAVCGTAYPPLGQTWDLIPYERVGANPIWRPWLHTQENGLVGYQQDPAANLALGNRADCLAFARFCDFDGPVLDVGCGPQGWPTYFNIHSARTCFVGIDPLVSGSFEFYPQLRALGEYLPFRAGVFRHVVFATSFDHLLEPDVALLESARVLSNDGEIALWVGEKDPGAPAVAASPEWYQALTRPEGAQDLFHLKRLTRDDVYRLASVTGLEIVDEHVEPVSEHRRNCFIRLRPGRR